MAIARPVAFLLVACVGLAATSARSAAAPPDPPAGAFGWRGDGTGRFPGVTPPLQWDGKSAAWSTELPGPGNCSPALAPDRIFVTAEPTTLLAVAREDGRILWQHHVTWADTVPESERESAAAAVAAALEVEKELHAALARLDELRRDLRRARSDADGVRARMEETRALANALRKRVEETEHLRPPEPIEIIGNASPTPVTDGVNVWASFGSSIVVSFTREGRLRWARRIEDGKATSMHGFDRGHTASPLLVGRVLLVTLGHLRALDADTGEVLWTSIPWLAYGTPVVARLDDGEVIIAPEGEIIRVSDGAVLADLGTDTYYVGPAIDGRVVFFAGNHGDKDSNKARARAVELPERAGAAPFVPRPLWERPLPDGRYYATPLADDGHLFLIDDQKQLQVLDGRTGRTLVRRALRVGGHAMPSPLRAGDHVFVFSDQGAVVTLRAAPPFRQVASSSLGGGMLGTPVVDGGRVFVRLRRELLCIDRRRP